MDEQQPVFMRDTNNVYSTAKFIVAQDISIVVEDGCHYTTTIDKFYKRTAKRDKQYAVAFLTEPSIVTGGRINADITKRFYMD